MQVIFIGLNRPIVFPTKTIRWQIAHCIGSGLNLDASNTFYRRFFSTTAIAISIVASTTLSSVHSVFLRMLPRGAISIALLELKFFSIHFELRIWYDVRKRGRSDRQLMATSVYVRDLLLCFLLLFYC